MQALAAKAVFSLPSLALLFKLVIFPIATEKRASKVPGIKGNHEKWSL